MSRDAWEYHRGDAETLDKFMALANQLGEQGWELVGY